jgi:hypothetical protein
MEFLGIGPLELFFIVLIALIVLGPKDMVKAGHTLGKLMRRTILSPTWLGLQKRIRNLPYEMMRQAGLDEEDLRMDVPKLDLNSPKVKNSNRPRLRPDASPPVEWTTPPSREAAPDWAQTHQIMPPAEDPGETPPPSSPDPQPGEEQL